MQAAPHSPLVISVPSTRSKFKFLLRLELPVCVSVRTDVLGLIITLLGIRFPACHIANSRFNLETPWSISMHQWRPKEKQFCNCQTDDGMVKRTGNQLCKLRDVSHTSICSVTVWKLELFFVNIEKKRQRLYALSYEENYCTMSKLSVTCSTTPLIFSPHLTCGSRAIRIVLNLLLLLLKETNTMELYRWLWKKQCPGWQRENKSYQSADNQLVSFCQFNFKHAGKDEKTESEVDTRSPLNRYLG